MLITTYIPDRISKGVLALALMLSLDLVTLIRMAMVPTLGGLLVESFMG